MKIFGITGGSGTGKSTVSKIFRENGIYVADADAAAREVTARGSECLWELAEYFGHDILRGDKSLNRQRLGEIVFSDRKKLVKLNEITHKYILASLEIQLRELQCHLAAIDGAVIIGSPVHKLCSFLVSVMADEAIRVKRICQRDGISEDKAKKRINSQPKDKIYIENSKYLIYNNNGIEQLENETQKVLNKIIENEV